MRGQYLFGGVTALQQPGLSTLETVCRRVFSEVGRSGIARRLVVVKLIGINYVFYHRLLTYEHRSIYT